MNTYTDKIFQKEMELTKLKSHQSLKLKNNKIFAKIDRYIKEYPNIDVVKEINNYFKKYQYRNYNLEFKKSSLNERIEDSTWENYKKSKQIQKPRRKRQTNNNYYDDKPTYFKNTKNSVYKSRNDLHEENFSQRTDRFRSSNQTNYNYEKLLNESENQKMELRLSNSKLIKTIHDMQFGHQEELHKMKLYIRKLEQEHELELSKIRKPIMNYQNNYSSQQQYYNNINLQSCSDENDFDFNTDAKLNNNYNFSSDINDNVFANKRFSYEKFANKHKQQKKPVKTKTKTKTEKILNKRT